MAVINWCQVPEQRFATLPEPRALPQTAHPWPATWAPGYLAQRSRNARRELTISRLSAR